MKKIIELIKKKRELIVYIICGVLTTVVSFVVQYLSGFVLIGDRFVEVRTVISWIAAVVFAFFVNKIFVFENGEKKGGDTGHALKQFFAFVGMRLISLGMEVVIISLGVRLTPADNFSIGIFGFEYSFDTEFIYKLISQVVVVISNYFFSKFVIFRKSDHDQKK